MVTLMSKLSNRSEYALIPMPPPESNFWIMFDLDGYNGLVSNGIQRVIFKQYDKFVVRELNKDVVQEFLKTIDNGRYCGMSYQLYLKEYKKCHGCDAPIIPKYFRGIGKFKYTILYDHFEIIYY
jgi:hypothetical protein